MFGVDAGLMMMRIGQTYACLLLLLVQVLFNVHQLAAAEHRPVQIYVQVSPYSGDQDRLWREFRIMPDLRFHLTRSPGLHSGDHKSVVGFLSKRQHQLVYDAAKACVKSRMDFVNEKNNQQVDGMVRALTTTPVLAIRLEDVRTRQFQTSSFHYKTVADFTRHTAGLFKLIDGIHADAQKNSAGLDVEEK